MKIGERPLGPEHPAYLIAEAGVNHNGELDLALQLVEAAARAGADAVKFQTFKARNLVTARSPKADYQLQLTDPGQSQLKMLEALELDEAQHRQLQQRCLELGVEFLSTPFDAESLQLLRRLGVSALKLGSGELTDLPLLRQVNVTGLPVILSTGMSGLSEIEKAVTTLSEVPLAILHCVSNYPARPEDCHLKAMDTLRAAFGVPVGYSDHTLGLPVALAAVARGACILEKHLTLSQELPGPDHKASLEPHEFAELVRQVRTVEAALGTGRKRIQESELPIRAVARKSLVTLADVPAGGVLTAANLGVRRPGTGLAPERLEEFLGRRVRHALEAGTVLAPDAVE